MLAISATSKQAMKMNKNRSSEYFHKALKWVNKNDLEINYRILKELHIHWLYNIKVFTNSLNYWSGLSSEICKKSSC